MRSLFAAASSWIFLSVLGLLGSSALASGQDLTVTSTHAGAFQFGQTNAYYFLRVSNVGATLSSGFVSVMETVPTGLTITSMSGDGWTCTVNSCGRSDAVGAGRFYPVIVVMATVAPNAGWWLTNKVTVAGGGDVNTANNTATDLTAVVESGYPVAWGSNDAKQSDVPAGLDNVVAVAGGQSHSLALTSDGTVVAWGDNTSGQSKVPAGLDNVIAVAAGAQHSLALQSDGTVVAWGDNTYGQTKVPASLANVIAIAAGGNYSLALESNGVVLAWGNKGAPIGQAIPGTISLVTAIATGGAVSLAVRNNETIVGWGDDSWGQTNVPGTLTNAVAFGIGGAHCIALKSDGTVAAWGNNSWGQTNVPGGLNYAVSISAGQSHNLALKSTGTVVAWGENNFGQTTLPSGLSSVTAIAAGWYNSIAVVARPSLRHPRCCVTEPPTTTHPRRTPPR